MDCKTNTQFHPTMRSTFIFSSLLALLASLLPLLASGAVTDYIASEGPIAKAGVLANIGASGSKAAGAKAGIVRRAGHRAGTNC